MEINERKLAIAVMILLLLACAALQFYYYDKLPPQVAIHFNIHGQADSVVKKNRALIINLIFPALFTIGFWGLSRLPYHMSDEWMSVPNSEYWLAPERRNFTVKKISMFVLLSGILTLLFILIISYLVILTNLSGGGELSNAFIVAVAAFILGNVLLSVYIIKYFNKIEK